VWKGKRGTLTAKARKNPRNSHCAAAKLRHRSAHDLVAHDHEVEAAGMRVQPEDCRQHEHGADHGVHEKLYRGVNFALVAEDADQQRHRDQRGFPEEVKEKEIERGEDADQRGFEKQ